MMAGHRRTTDAKPRGNVRLRYQRIAANQREDFLLPRRHGQTFVWLTNICWQY
jgi:hypothetical protein